MAKTLRHAQGKQDLAKKALALHKKLRGKIRIVPAAQKIITGPFEKGIAQAVAKAIA